jgi:hypothetical protein
MEYPKTHLKNVILGLLLILCKGINGQTVHNISHVEKEGLYNENILGICQDEKGLIWIENSNEFVLYDGYQSQIQKKNNSSFRGSEDILPCQVTYLNIPKIKQTPSHSNARIISRFEKGADRIRFKDHSLNDWDLSPKRILKNEKLINIENIEKFLQQHKGKLKFTTYLQSIAGVIWVGTNKGLLKIVEDNHESIETIPISLTKIQYYDLKEEKWKPINSNRDAKTGLVEMTLQNNPLRLSFALANYHSPITNVFEYRFKGQHEAWIDNGTNNQIICGSLEPGKYELEIRGRHINGNWVSSLVPLLILAPPHPINMYILWLAIFVGIILLSYLCYQSRSLSKLSLLSFKRSISKEINNRIEDDVARMAMEIELLRTNICPKDQQRLMMKNISTSSRNVISTIGDVLWMIDIRRDTIEHLLDRIKEQANETLGNQGIETSFSTHVLSAKESIPFAFKQSFFFFCKEAMGSIAMNPEIEYVHISLQEKPMQFELSFALDKKMAFGTICKKTMRKESQKLKGKLFFQQKGMQLIVPNPKGLNIKSLTRFYLMNQQLG